MTGRPGTVPYSPSRMATPPPALDRVRKLLALATSPNPHEAAVAAAHAQKLIEAHRLHEWLAATDEVGCDPDPIEDGRDAPLETARRIRKWKIVLANVLAEANGCVAFTYTAEGRDEAIALVGRSRDRAAVAELWGWLVKRIEWLSATHGAGRSRQWHEAFRIGVVDAVAHRLTRAGEEARAEVGDAALVHVDPRRVAHRAALDRFVDERLRLGRGRAIRVDGRAWQRGRAASGDLDLP